MTIDNLRALIQRAQAGDTQAFGEIYEQCFAPVYRYCFCRLGNKESAEDIAQTVFIKAYRSLDSFRDTGKHILAYFFTIARNTIIDQSRKHRELAHEPKDLADIPDDYKSPLDLALEHDHNPALGQAMSQLPAEQQEAIILKFIEGFSNKDIAQIMDKSEAAIRQLQSRGLRSLRAKIKNEQ